MHARVISNRVHVPSTHSNKHRTAQARRTGGLCVLSHTATQKHGACQRCFVMKEPASAMSMILFVVHITLHNINTHGRCV